MSGLAALLAGHNSPDIYQWHSAAAVADVQHAVEHAGWGFAYLDGWTTEDAPSFLKGAVSALGLPDSAAESVDAFGAALSDVGAGSAHGLVFLWDGWSPLARHDEATFTSALEALRARARQEGGDKVAVILRGEGPDLDLEELPHKH